MKEEQIFSEALSGIVALAQEQDRVVSEEQVRDAFLQSGMELGAEQLSLVHEYLKGKKIGIGEPVDPFDYLSAEEADYLAGYLKELEAFENVPDGESEAITLSAMAGDPDAKARLIELFLPKVAQIAQLYAGQGAFLEDLIGEGNVALMVMAEMLEEAQNAEEAQGQLASAIMEAMENYIGENVEEKKTGDAMAQKANDVLEQAQALARELGRKVTVEELAGESGMSEEQIREAVRITGDNIEDLDAKG